MYLPEILIPLAAVKVDEAAQRQSDLDDQKVIDEIALALYRRHRSEGNKSKVQERTWDKIPNSEKGKYRGIVVAAIQKYRRTH
jgi:hypothetical protein